jgi:hypothetical protein
MTRLRAQVPCGLSSRDHARATPDGGTARIGPNHISVCCAWMKKRNQRREGEEEGLTSHSRRRTGWRGAPTRAWATSGRAAGRSGRGARAGARLPGRAGQALATRRRQSGGWADVEGSSAGSERQQARRDGFQGALKALGARVRPR